jgi:hypothetical protein
LWKVSKITLSTTSEALMAGTIIITIVKPEKPCAQFYPNIYTTKKTFTDT